MDAASRYEWDAGNLAKCQTHGVTIAEIEHVLDNDPFLVPDYEHSGQEDRSIAVGTNRPGRRVFVVFTIRVREGREVVRPLSARYMHKKEIERYERLWRQEGPKVQDR
jgi:uncharacterized DUF497 family protein